MIGGANSAVNAQYVVSVWLNCYKIISMFENYELATPELLKQIA